MNNYNGCRSKISLLPHQVRWRIYNLLLDGATLKAILNDPEVKTSLDQAGFTLNTKNISLIRKNREFIDFVQMRRKYLERKYKDMMTAAIARGTNSLESMTDQTRCKLMETLSELADLSDLPDEERIKAVRSLSQSVASLSNPVKDTQIAELKRQLAEAEKRIADLLAELDRMKNVSAPGSAAAGLSETAIRQAEEKIKLL